METFTSTETDSVTIKKKEKWAYCRRQEEDTTTISSSTGHKGMMIYHKVEYSTMSMCFTFPQ